MTQESDSKQEFERLEARLARLEAQLHSHTEQLDGFHALEKRRRQRGLVFRLLVLLAMVLFLFFLKSRGGP